MGVRYLGQPRSGRGSLRDPIPGPVDQTNGSAATLTAVEFHVSLVGRKDLAGEIYRQLRRAILDGRLPSGGRLPATRELAAQLSVSRTTVVVAYDRLLGEGFITARVGAGPFPSDAPPGSGPVAGAERPARSCGPGRSGTT